MPISPDWLGWCTYPQMKLPPGPGINLKAVIGHSTITYLIDCLVDYPTIPVYTRSVLVDYSGSMGRNSRIATTLIRRTLALCAPHKEGPITSAAFFGNAPKICHRFGCLASAGSVFKKKKRKKDNFISDSQSFADH